MRQVGRKGEVGDMDDLEDRVRQFNCLALPGQPLGMHLGTAHLVNDLWREVQHLRQPRITPVVPVPGLYTKYIIEKADGSPVDPNAKYFVLRIDTDCHARIALSAYAESIAGDAPEFSRQLQEWLVCCDSSDGNDEV